VLLTASYFPLVIEAFGCQLGTASGPNMTLWRRRCLRISLHVEQLETVNRYRATIYVQRPHWLDYDPVALAVLVIGIGTIELFALII
jgi:hypothetical protein